MSSSRSEIINQTEEMFTFDCPHHYFDLSIIDDNEAEKESEQLWWNEYHDFNKYSTITAFGRTSTNSSNSTISPVSDEKAKNDNMNHFMRPLKQPRHIHDSNNAIFNSTRSMRQLTGPYRETYKPNNTAPGIGVSVGATSIETSTNVRLRSGSSSRSRDVTVPIRAPPENKSTDRCSARSRKSSGTTTLSKQSHSELTKINQSAANVATVPAKAATKTVKTVTSNRGISSRLVNQTPLNTGAKSLCKRGLSDSSAALISNSELVNMVRQHNQKIKQVPAYEPPHHSVRDVRAWEKRVGKQWISLTTLEREQANCEIANMKNNVA